MNKIWLKQNLLLIIFVIFVANYTILLLINAQLGPTDDFIFLKTLQIGKPLLYYSQNFPYYDATKLGRFIPMAAMEYNLIGLFSKSPSPFWYYFYHAIQFIFFMILFAKLLSKFTSNKFLIYLTPILLSLTPGFTIAWFRMQINERNLIFFLVIFLLCYLAYLKNQKTILFGLGLLFANLAIYYKETGFIAIGAFAFFHLLLSWKTAGKKIKIFDGLLLLSSFIYLLLYYFIVYLHLSPDTPLYGHTDPNLLLLVLTTNLINYSFFTDSILIFILLPFTAWRIYKALRRQLELHPVYDSMLMTSLIYVIAFFVLKMCNPYFLLPAYIFALPPLFYFWTQKKQLFPLFKPAAVICALVLILNTLPAGIHYLTYYKYLSVNFNKAFDFLVSDINYRYPDKRADIFFDAVNPTTKTDISGIMGEFLQYKGLSRERFDFKSDIKIESGDYLIVPSEAITKNITNAYIQSLTKDYDLLFRTESPLAFPSFNLKILTKYLLSEKLKEKGIIISKNFTHWPNYYVFIRR